MIQVESVLRKLAEKRPVFHSEADLQHALAWEIRLASPTAEVRLERPMEGGKGRIYLDLWVDCGDGPMGIELKYTTRRLEVASGGEVFELRNQGAQDLRRYDFLADIMRIEGLLGSGKLTSGLAVFLTNDQSYWTDTGRTGRADDAFRIHEDEPLTGERRWAPHASDGTQKGRKVPIALSGIYHARWSDYSEVGGHRFRYLLLNVAKP